MFTHLLSEAILPQRSSNAAAAGTSVINGAAVDLQATPGALGVMFIALLGTLTATQVTSLKAQWSDDNSTWSDFTTSNVTGNAADADSNKMLVLDVYKPQHRYVRPVLVRGTANAVLDGIVAIPYHLRAMPAPAFGSTVSQSAKFVESI